MPVDADSKQALNDFSEKIGFPGRFPFTRGVYPTMYRGKPWTIRQYAGFGSAEETNARFQYLLKQGGRGLSVAFDLPTQLGLDSDYPRSRGEVGRVGVAIDSLADMETLLNGIDLSQVSTSMTINATATTLLALYLTVAEKQGVAFSHLRGTVQNDILKEFIARGNYIYAPKGSLRLAVDTIEYCDHKVPKWYPISISGYHMREAGATAVQELAFTFANALEYVRACKARKLDLGRIASRLTFFFSVDNDFVEEVAKFRAARRLWAKLLIDKFHFDVEDKAALGLRFHAQTGGSTLTARQPHNNLARVAMQALAAALGGTQSLHTNAWDEALSLPTEASAKLALETQKIAQQELGVTSTIDALGGSLILEEKTEQLFEESLALIEKTERFGGALKLVESGWMQQEIGASAYRHQLDIESKQRLQVGVNCLEVDEDEDALSLWELDSQLESTQIAKVQAWRRERSQVNASRSLDNLKRELASENNLMPAILEAVKNSVTLGEISDAVEQHFGTFQVRAFG